MKTTIKIAAAAIAIMAAAMPAAAAKPKLSPAEDTARQDSLARVQEVKDSLQNILEQAKAGDAKAQCTVGYWYYKGLHTAEKDYNKAYAYWKRSAAQNYAPAIGNLGLCYQYGNGIEADSAKAAMLFLKSFKLGNKIMFKEQYDNALKGNVFSAMLMGRAFRQGIGTKATPSEAIKMYTIAANKNCVESYLPLGVLLLNDKQTDTAIKVFKKGVDANVTACIYHYGNQMLKKAKTRQEQEAAANYILRAAEEGFPQAMNLLGDLYAEGKGVTRSAEQAYKWHLAAAGKGVKKAQWEVAQACRRGNGTEVSYDQAARWYSAAIADNQAYIRPFRALCTDSLRDTPFMAYLDGLRLLSKENFTDAAKKFKVVEKAKISDGRLMEGIMLVNPRNPKADYKKGVKMLEKAIKDGNPQAMYALAKLRLDGTRIEQNPTQGLGLLTQSAALGYAQAQCALGDMYFEGRGVDQNYSEAARLYNEAYEQGQLTPNAARRYADILQRGLGDVPVDEDLAENVLKPAAQGSLTSLLREI